MKIIAITQARIGSSRLPKKVLLPLGKDTLLGTHLERLKQSKLLDKIIVATTEEEESILICEIAKAKGLKWFKGSLNDVLDRFYQAARTESPDYVVRVTSDCPLIDPQLLDAVISEAIKGGYDYYSNIFLEEFPDGQDIEVFKMGVLEQAWKEGILTSEREHVTPYIRNNSDFNGGKLFRSGNYPAPANFNHVRMTVDEPADYETMRWLIDKIGISKSWKDYTDYMIENTEKLKNNQIIRNEGYLKSKQND
jgi:spore coat polysaccharide biosynthesis protein SpsF